ncbi:hypothetical protein E2320_022964 [Naja naja]|nr:hypothetical protein E2320_022964 [Naja naja]
MLNVTWSERTLVNISFNNTEIVEITSNKSNISEIFSSPYDESFHNLTENLFSVFCVIICILGLVGNGMTIYLLAFSIKRNSFTTFILNLSIADFGVLTSLIMEEILWIVLTLGKGNGIVETFQFFFSELFLVTYSASQFLLTAISLDRCVAVLFPLWHRCHRPPYLPTLVCVLIWILCFPVPAVNFILYKTREFGYTSLWLYQLIVNGLLCTPLMVVSTVTLLIHRRSKLQLNQRKLLTVILLALLFFLLFSLPMDVFYVIEYFGSSNLLLMTIGMECASFQQQHQPTPLFLSGRKKRKDQPRASLKLALQRVFKDEQDSLRRAATTEENIL